MAISRCTVIEDLNRFIRVVGSLDTVPEELDKDSNSVSTQGKEMLSLHACTKCI